MKLRNASIWFRERNLRFAFADVQGLRGDERKVKKYRQ